jgi:hypothetical protein
VPYADRLSRACTLIDRPPWSNLERILQPRLATSFEQRSARTEEFGGTNISMILVFSNLLRCQPIGYSYSAAPKPISLDPQMLI